MINFDIISSDLSQGGQAVIRGFKTLRKQLFFQQIEVSRKDFIIWCDCGPHFRNKELIGYLLLNLSEENIPGKMSNFITDN
jgi:hypothetical protein